MGRIRDRVIEYIEFMHEQNEDAWVAKYAKLPPRVHVSDLGHCVRASILTLKGVEPTDPFKPYVLEVMRAGNVWEEETWNALRLGAIEYGDEVSADGLVFDEHWAGSKDFMFEGDVIEHKATSPYNYNARDKQPDGSYIPRLPYEWNALQVLGYAKLHAKMHNALFLPDTWLYYRSWNNWMEIQVHDKGDHIAWEGEKNGKVVEGRLEVSIDAEMAKFEAAMDSGLVPERYQTPIAENFTCCSFNKRTQLAWPRCRFFHYCWREVCPGPGPIEL